MLGMAQYVCTNVHTTHLYAYLFSNGMLPAGFTKKKPKNLGIRFPSQVLLMLPEEHE